MTERRYVVLGAGAVGITLAAQLQEAGRNVLVVARGAQLEALRAGRLRYVRIDGPRELTLTAAGSPEEVRLRPDDVLVATVKTQDVDTLLAAWAQRPVQGRTEVAGALLPVLTLQNGLAAEDLALRRFATVIGGVLWMAADHVTPGEVTCASAPAAGVLWLGRHPGGRDIDARDPLVDAIAGDLWAAGLEVQVVEDIGAWKTAKLLTSVTFALDALFPPGELRDEVAALVTREAREVLAAAGRPAADVARDSTVDLCRFHVEPVPGRERGSSTWQSLTRAGSLETDHLNGEVVLLARRLGRRAPLNEALVARVHRAQRDGERPRSLGRDELLALAGTVTVGA